MWDKCFICPPLAPGLPGLSANGHMEAYWGNKNAPNLDCDENSRAPNLLKPLLYTCW